MKQAESLRRVHTAESGTRAASEAILSSNEWHNDMNPAFISTIMAPNFEFKVEDDAALCVCCVARSAPTLRFVMSVRSTIVLNVLTPTLVGPMLFVKYNTNDSWSC